MDKYYNFITNILTCDFESSLRKKAKIIYPEVLIFPCYYHFIKSIKKNLLLYYNYNKKQLKNSIIYMQIIGHYLLLEMKNDNIKAYFKFIKDEYGKSDNWKNAKIFFDYFKLKKMSIQEWIIYNVTKISYDNNT